MNDVEEKIVSEYIKTLRGKDKKIAKLYYGIGGNEQLTPVEIAETLKLSYNYVSYYVYKLEEAIELRLYVESKKRKPVDNEDDYYEVEKVDEETQKMIYKMSDTFFDMFPHVNRISVEYTLKKVPKKSRDIIFLYYGLDGVHCLDYDEIAEKYNITVDEVDELMEEGIKTLKSILKKGKLVAPYIRKDNRENKYDLLVEKYGKEKFLKAMKLLPLDTQNMIIDYCIEKKVKTLKEMARKYGLSAPTVYQRINNGLKIVEDNIDVLGFNKFYSNFIGYDKKSVDEALLSLTVKEINMISLFYGLKGEKMLQKQIGEKYGITSSAVSIAIKKSIQKMISLMENKNVKEKKKPIKKDVVQEKETRGISKRKKVSNEYNEIVDKYGEEKVSDALSKLDERSKKIIVLYFGVDCERIKQRKIAQIYNITPGFVSVIVKKSIKTMISILENKYEYVSRKDQFYNRFKGYSKEQVDVAIEALDDKQKQIIKEFYFSESESITLKEISRKHNVSNKYIYAYLNRALKKIDDILSGKEIDNKRRTRPNCKNSLYEEMITKYGKEKIDEAISKLDEKEQKIIKEYFGVDGDSLSYSKIAIKNNLPVGSINYKIKSSIKKIMSILEDKKPSFTRKSEFYNKFDGYSQEQIDFAISQLREVESNLIRDYYLDEDAMYTQKDLAQKYNTSVQSISMRLSKAVKKISRILKDPEEALKTKKSVKKTRTRKNDNRFVNLVEKYGKEQVDVAYKSLSEKEQEIIGLYFGLNEGFLSQKGIAEKYNMSANYVCLFIKKTLVKLVDHINNPIIQERTVEETPVLFDVSEDGLRDMKFKKILGKYEDDIVREGIDQLSDSEKAFLVMYYTLGNIRYYSLAEISSKIGVDEKKLAYLEDKILKKLERILNSKLKKKILIRSMQKEFVARITNDKYKEAMQSLSKNELKLIALYYGLNGTDIMTSKELADMLKISEFEVKDYIYRIVKKINNYSPGEDRKSKK